MAITYPRVFPVGATFLRSQFTLSRQTVVTRYEGGRLAVAEMAEPFWTFAATTRPLRWSGRREWAAWNTSLAGGFRTILAYDWIGSYPIAYGAGVLGLNRAIGGAFVGIANLSAWTATTLTLSGLPAGYIATAGDKVSFGWNGTRAYHEVTETVAANGSGIVTVSVEPPVRIAPAPTAGAVVDLVRPTCEMVVKADTFSLDEASALGSVAFEAVQKVV